METDPPPRRLWRRHEPPDCIKKRSDLHVVPLQFPLQFRQLLSKSPAAGQHLPKFHERSHDGDVYLYSPLAPKHTGKHGHALFGECLGWEASAATPRL